MTGRSTVTDEDVARTLALFDRGAGALIAALAGRNPRTAYDLAEDAAQSAPNRAAGDPAGRGGGAARRAVRAVVEAARPDPRASLEDRCEWWTARIRNLAAIVPAAPRVLGALADRVPAAAAASAAVQGLAVTALAQEYGVIDRADRVSLLSQVITDRALTAEEVRAVLAEPAHLTARLRGLLRIDDIAAAGAVRRGWLVAGGAWRLAGLVGAIDDVLGGRSKGGWIARGIGQIPAIGVAGGYLAERAAIRTAVRRARRILDQRGRATPSRAR